MHSRLMLQMMPQQYSRLTACREIPSAAKFGTSIGLLGGSTVETGETSDGHSEKKRGAARGSSASGRNKIA